MWQELKVGPHRVCGVATIMYRSLHRMHCQIVEPICLTGWVLDPR
eukprot:COSAG02_NODE_108_length_36286_cov_19.437478_27_plen_45_part_00